MSSVTFCLVILLSLGIALYSRRGHHHQGTRDFFVASGQFGGALLFFLAVGETYSIGTVLGFPAGTVSHGTAFVLWFLSYIVLAFPVGYFLNPRIWQAGQACNALTLADLFRHHVGSRAVEIAMALNAILFLLPFGDMQFVGLLTVLQGFGWQVPSILLTTLAAVMAFFWVALSGIRAPAYVSILKDVLMIVAVVAVGGAALLAMGHLPDPHQAGRAVGQDIADIRPTGRDEAFAMSTVILQSIGFCVAPQTVAFLFTGRSRRIVRRNQVLMPLYMLMFPFLYLVAEYARRSGMALPTPNDAFMTVSLALLPGWMDGLVAAACTLSALVVLAGMCLAIGSLVSHNLLHGLSDRQQRYGAQVVIALYLLFSVVSAAHASGVLVKLNTMYYFGVTQAAPGLFAILLARPVRPAALVAGLLAGDGLSVGLYLGGVDLGGINPGLVGLVANAAILWAGSYMPRRR
ncbi:Na+/solute symporter [Gluconacetobacter diazotrophicus PA1 5]|uniref:sodium:solute symporter family protein n=1 Tax=Gluconacetobacter diazotrophicus TaxID=33996 RepID=UPI000173B122|nr:sodium:solute symporter [Gluconacetobacter diazotrophicus]ACI50548.1 Na+/solute symporter [Gluconacetobacter diazotrophicus PA1 5]TWB09380.1 SSS family solute:Na+ symporter [Gluconacetobacter diazotrophicus]